MNKFQTNKIVAVISLIIGTLLVVGGMLLFGRIDIPSWLHGLIIFFGFFVTSFGTKILRCKQCNKFVDLDTGECQHCK